MSGRSSILGILRRRRASVGRIALAWFVLASSSVGAAPCFAMARSDALAPQHDAAPPSATGHAHSHAMAHDHSVEHAKADPTPQPSSPCPHCPLSAAMAGDGASSSHGLCSAGDDVSDGGKPSATPLALKTIVALPIIELLPADPKPSLVREKQRPPDANVVSIALNLRHCVFLI